jgi:hypothetical protein
MSAFFTIVMRSAAFQVIMFCCLEEAVRDGLKNIFGEKAFHTLPDLNTLNTSL